MWDRFVFFCNFALFIVIVVQEWMTTKSTKRLMSTTLMLKARWILGNGNISARPSKFMVWYVWCYNSVSFFVYMTFLCFLVFLDMSRDSFSLKSFGVMWLVYSFRILGVFAPKDASDDEEAEDARPSFGRNKRRKDYTAPVAFVSGGIKQGDRVTKPGEQGDEEVLFLFLHFYTAAVVPVLLSVVPRAVTM